MHNQEAHSCTADLSPASFISFFFHSLPAFSIQLHWMLTATLALWKWSHAPMKPRPMKPRPHEKYNSNQYRWFPNVNYITYFNRVNVRPRGSCTADLTRNSLSLGLMARTRCSTFLLILCTQPYHMQTLTLDLQKWSHTPWKLSSSPTLQLIYYCKDFKWGRGEGEVGNFQGFPLTKTLNHSNINVQ